MEQLISAKDARQNAEKAIASERIARDQKKRADARANQLADLRSWKEWLEREIKKIEEDKK